MRDEKIKIEGIEGIKMLDLKEVPPEIKREAYTKLMIYGWCYIVKDKDGNYCVGVE